MSRVVRACSPIRSSIAMPPLVANMASPFGSTTRARAPASIIAAIRRFSRATGCPESLRHCVTSASSRALLLGVAGVLVASVGRGFMRA